MEDDRRGPGASSSRTVAVVLVFILVVALILFTTPSTHRSVVSTTTTAVPSTTTTSPVQARSSTTVQVANATSVSGAATSITTKLQDKGWNLLPPLDASSKATTSSVYFAAGKQAAAQEIARELGLPSSVVAALPSDVPVAGATGDDVVVLVGDELAKA